MADKPSPYPLYNTTYTSHRLSPLYLGDATPTLLDDATLAKHSRRLNDILKGNIVLGVQIGNGVGGDEGLGRAGFFQSCRWTVLKNERAWAVVERRQFAEEEDADPESRDEEDASDVGELAGVMIEVRYERATYMGLMLRNPEASEISAEFIHLPLLLLRMPGPLKEILLDYLATTFDTRVSPMILPPDFLSWSLERFLGDLTGNGDRQDVQNLKSIVKDIQITLKFPTAAPALNSLDIKIPQENIPIFVSRGKKILRQKSSVDAPRTRKRKWSPSDDAGQPPAGPFMAAFNLYIKTHMALSLSHADVRISKIACGAFVLGAEGKVKIFPQLRHDAHLPTKATHRFIQSLVSRAKQNQMLGKNSISGRFGADVELPLEVHVDDAPPPYELHDPSLPSV
ncbi:MAG: hypothetical protein M1827_001838 [Pycnora praestabilis]|nr:MAG: hypothetical protein M1827_001838 [Pycnora praestabilis]